MGENYNVSMFTDSTEGAKVFYVRPFSEEVKNDLDRLMRDVSKVSDKVAITENNGTYAISTEEPVTEKNFIEGFWGILFRRFLVESKRVCKDPISEEKYYVLIFSASYINPCARRLAA